MKIRSLLISVLLIAGCATPPKETVSIEKKGKVTIVHHRSKFTGGAKDRIEAVNDNGSFSVAEVKVYDVGRYVDASGSVHEAHKVYRTVQSKQPNLMLPKTVSTGPRTVYTPPTYTPPTEDQRAKDAIADAEAAKKKLDAQTEALKAEQVQVQTKEQLLQDAINAGMPDKRQKTGDQTDAQKAATLATNPLATWYNQTSSQ